MASVSSARRRRDSESATTPADPLDSLLRQRWGGAANIRGVRFQTRYALWRASDAADAIRSMRTPDLPAADGDDGVTASSRATQAERDLHEPLIRFEGVEDVDVANPALGPLAVCDGKAASDWELIQVKTTSKTWPWSKLRDPLQNWLPVVRTGALGIRLRLVVNATLHGDLAELASMRSLPQPRQRDIRQKFRKLAAAEGATAAEADAVLDVLVIESLPDDELRHRLQVTLTSAFDVVDTAALEALELALVSRVLQWSADRAQITASALLTAGHDIGSGLARQEQFRAVAHGLFGRFNVSPDATPDDFFAGRQTRSGHVAAGLDVRREHWMQQVDAALSRAGVCVLRGPSGHGKSTLAFRYVYEHWPLAHTIVVRSAATVEDVAALTDYMTHRRSIGLPVRVLIDATYQTQLWPQVAAAAAAVGGHVLVTVRAEDYHRYPLHALTRREILELTLTRDEATEIFSVFKQRGRIAPNVASAAWAFERLRKPSLLLEYVFVITQGEMLADRLRGQISTMRHLHEDPAKQDVLRLVSTASALGAPITLEGLLGALQLRDDPQHVLHSMVGEYLEIDGGLVNGLHWVRSRHLAHVLHDGGVPSIHSTMLRLVPLVPEHAVAFLVAGALEWDGVDDVAFLKGLVSHYGSVEIDQMLPVLDGLFEAGERAFFAANRARFDAAAEVVGAEGLLFFWVDIAPALPGTTLRDVADILEERSGFARFRDWATQVGDARRGVHYVRDFLRAVLPVRLSETLAPSRAAGQLLTWCAFAAVEVPHWSTRRDVLLAAWFPASVSFEASLELAAGIHQYDQSAFAHWFAQHRRRWLAIVQYHARGVEVHFAEPSTVATVELARSSDAGWEESSEARSLSKDDRSIAIRNATAARDNARRHGGPTGDIHVRVAYHVDGSVTIDDHTTATLDILRRAIPCAGRYVVVGDHLLPIEMRLPFIDVDKHVPRWNLPLPSDVAKNRVFGQIVARAYQPDSFYRLQELWAGARGLALDVVRRLRSALINLFRRTAVGDQQDLSQQIALVSNSLREAQWLTIEQLSSLGQPISLALREHIEQKAPLEWRGGMQNFVRQIVTFLVDSVAQRKSGLLAVVNFGDAERSLPGMHAFFDAMFRDSPDYFDMRALKTDELKAYSDLATLLHGFVESPVAHRLMHPVADLRARERERVASEVAAICRALEPLRVAGQVVLLPRDIHLIRTLRSIVVGVELPELERSLSDSVPVLQALEPVADKLDLLYIVPTYRGDRIGDAAYSLSARYLRAAADLESLSEEDMTQLALSLSVSRPVPAELMGEVTRLPLAEQSPRPSVQHRLASTTAVLEASIHRRTRIAQIGGASPLPEQLALRALLRREGRAVEEQALQAAATIRESLAQDGRPDHEMLTRLGQLCDALRAAANRESDT